MNDLDLCLEVIQGHVNHCGVNISKTTCARNFKFGTRLNVHDGHQAGTQVIFPKSGRLLGHVTPEIFGIRSNISNIFITIWASDFKLGKRLWLTIAIWLSGPAYYSVLWGSTVGYPSDSLACCSVFSRNFGLVFGLICGTIYYNNGGTCSSVTDRNEWKTARTELNLIAK